MLNGLGCVLKHQSHIHYIKCSVLVGRNLRDDYSNSDIIDDETQSLAIVDSFNFDTYEVPSL